jgi:hypothetical protein
MNSWLKRHAAAAIALSGVLTLAFALGATHRGEAKRIPPPSDNHAGELLGDALPFAPLTNSTGERVKLEDLANGKPALIYFLSEADCFGCTQYGAEAKILRRTIPGLQQIMVGIGNETDQFFDYARLNGLTPLVDVNDELRLTKSGITTPFVILVSSSGKVIFVDDRRLGRIKNPLSSIITDLIGETRSLSLTEHN